MTTNHFIYLSLKRRKKKGARYIDNAHIRVWYLWCRMTPGAHHEVVVLVLSSTVNYEIIIKWHVGVNMYRRLHV